MKKATALILILSLVLMLASCSDGSGSTLTCPVNGFPSTIDPLYAEGTSAQTVILNCFEGLVRLDEDGKVIPGVAESWSVSDDGLIYTFNLRKDSEWALVRKVNTATVGDDYEDFDTSVTAYDFVFAFTRAVKPDSDCPYANAFSIIKNAADVHNGKTALSNLGVNARDDYELTVALEEPCPDFLERLTENPFMPCNEEFFNLTGGRYGLSPANTLCNGPFYFRSSDSTTFTMRKNPVYKGQESVMPSEVNLVKDNDSTSVSEALASGKYSAALLNVTDYTSEGAVSVTKINNAVVGFCFNCRDEITENENVRLAFISCIHKADFTLPEFSGGYTKSSVPACCRVMGTPYSEISNGKISPVSNDAEAANACLAAAFEQLVCTSIDLNIICSGKAADAVRSQVQNCQKVLGSDVRLTVEVVDDFTLNSRLASGDFQIAFAPLYSSTCSAPEYLEYFVKGGSNNILRQKSPEYDLLVENIRGTTASTALRSACLDADRYLIEHGVFYPVYSGCSCFVEAEGVSGAYCTPAGGGICFISACCAD